MGVNVIDIVILILATLFVISGYRKGIIISLGSIAALILGIYAAVYFSNYLDALLLEHLNPSRAWLPILSFTFTFLLVVIGILTLAKLTEKVVDVVGMGIFNRLGGAMLGLVKGVIVISILLFITTSLDPKGKWITREDKKESYLYHRVAGIFPKLMKTFGGPIKFPSWESFELDK
jgi:membrane protein required for colicin V production